VGQDPYGEAGSLRPSIRVFAGQWFENSRGQRFGSTGRPKPGSRGGTGRHVVDGLAPVETQQWDAVIDDPADRYGATADTHAARAHGLMTRPLEETFARVLEYEERRDAHRRAGLSDSDELDLRGLLD